MAKRSWFNAHSNRAVVWVSWMGIASLTSAHAQESITPSPSNSLLSHPVIGELLVPGTGNVILPQPSSTFESNPFITPHDPLVPPTQSPQTSNAKYPDHVLQCEECRKRLGLPPIANETKVLSPISSQPSNVKQVPSTVVPHPVDKLPTQPLRSLTPQTSAAMQNGTWKPVETHEPTLRDSAPQAPVAPSIPRPIPSPSLEGLPLDVRQRVLRELDVPEGGKVLTLGVQPIQGSDLNSPSESTNIPQPLAPSLTPMTVAPVDAVAPADDSRLPPKQQVVAPVQEPVLRPSEMKPYDDREVKEILRRHESVLESLQRSQEQQLDLLQALKNSHAAETAPASSEYQKQMEMRQQEIQELKGLLERRNDELRHQENGVREKMQRMEREIEERSNANKKTMVELEEMREVLRNKESQQRDLQRAFEKSQSDFKESLEEKHRALEKEITKRTNLEREMQSLRSRLAQNEDQSMDSMRRSEAQRAAESARSRSNRLEQERAEILKKKLEEEKKRRSKEADRDANPPKKQVIPLNSSI